MYRLLFLPLIPLKPVNWMAKANKRRTLHFQIQGLLMSYMLIKRRALVVRKTSPKFMRLLPILLLFMHSGLFAKHH